MVRPRWSAPLAARIYLVAARTRRARNIANPANKIKTPGSNDPPPPPPPPLDGGFDGGDGVETGGGKVSFLRSRNRPFSMSLTITVPEGRKGYTPQAPSVPALLGEGDR